MVAGMMNRRLARWRAWKSGSEAILLQSGVGLMAGGRYEGRRWRGKEEGEGSRMVQDVPANIVARREIVRAPSTSNVEHPTSNIQGLHCAGGGRRIASVLCLHVNWIRSQCAQPQPSPHPPPPLGANPSTTKLMPW